MVFAGVLVHVGGWACAWFWVRDMHWITRDR